MSKVRVGVLGLTHDHVWANLAALRDSGQGELVAAADPHKELLDKVAATGCDAVFSRYEQLLDQVELDAVYVFSDNRESAELATIAAQRHLHVLLEKPMAADLAGAARLQAAVHAAGVQLMVNWPFAWWPRLQHALHLVEEGRIGQVFQVLYRAAHAGPREEHCSTYFSEWLYDPRRNGAGALMDYCSYGAALTCRLLGLPSRVLATTGRLRKQDLLAEDNAVLVMQHAAAISTATASWTQVGHMTSYVPMFYGSEGTLVVDREGLLLATHDDGDGSRIDVAAPPPEQQSATAYFLHRITTNQPITGLCSLETALAAQQVLEAALISARSGQSVSLPLAAERLRGV